MIVRMQIESRFVNVNLFMHMRGVDLFQFNLSTKEMLTGL